MAKKPEHGLLIDYEYCTGCYTCQIACCQEYGWEAGMSGMQIIEQVQNLTSFSALLPSVSLTAVFFPDFFLRGIRSILHSGQEPGFDSTISGCIGQVHNSACAV